MSGILSPNGDGSQEPLGTAAFVDDDTLVHRHGHEEIEGKKQFIGPVLSMNQDAAGDEKTLVNIKIGRELFMEKVDPVYIDPATNPFNVISRLNEIRDALIHAGILAP